MGGFNHGGPLLGLSIPDDGSTYGLRSVSGVFSVVEVEGGPGGGIEEAPADGKPYVREDEEWVEATAAEVGADVAGSAATVAGALASHAGNASNPHATTASQVGALATAAFEGVAKITVGTTAPVGPSVGDIWIDTSGA